MARDYRAKNEKKITHKKRWKSEKHSKIENCVPLQDTYIVLRKADTNKKKEGKLFVEEDIK